MIFQYSSELFVNERYQIKQFKIFPSARFFAYSRQNLVVEWCRLSQYLLAMRLIEKVECGVVVDQRKYKKAARNKKSSLKFVTIRCGTYL